jgi:hypothetical protein
LFDLDIENLKSNEALRDTISSREHSFDRIAASLEVDRSNFRGQVTGISAEDANGFSIVSTAYTRTLKKWFDARRELVDEQLSMVLEEESPDVKLVRDTLVRARRIRWAVTALEIFLPIAMAIAAISLFWLA